MRPSKKWPIFYHLHKNEIAAQPGHISLIEASDKWKGQCLVNTAGRVKHPIEAFPSRFLPVLQHVADRCHATKSLCSTLATMFVHGWAYPMIFSSPVTIRCKTPFLSAVGTVVHMWKDAVRRLSDSTQTASNFLAFELFLILSNVSKMLGDQLQIILQVQLASKHESLSSNASNSSSSNFSSAPERSLS